MLRHNLEPIPSAAGRFTVALGVFLWLLAASAHADDAVVAKVRQSADPAELADVLNDLGLFEVDLEQRAVLCFADHLSAVEINRFLISLEWPGPYFEGAGVGTAELVKAPRVPWSRFDSVENRGDAVAVRFAVNANGKVEGMRAEAPTSPDVLAAVRDGLRGWQFESAEVLGEPGAVCRRRYFFPPGVEPDPDDPPAITRDMVEAVTSADALIDMLLETRAQWAPANVRAALCWLPAEIPRSDLDRRLFDIGWPGPYLGSAALQKPKMIESTQPQYSEIARRQRVQGVVIIRFVINARGFTESFQIVEAVSPELAEMAIESLRHTTYESAQIYGRPVSSCNAKSVNFRLQ